MVLIYSMYLPAGLSLESCQEGRHFVRMQLAEALKKIKGGPDDAELSGGMRIGEDDKTDEQESVILRNDALQGVHTGEHCCCRNKLTFGSGL